MHNGCDIANQMLGYCEPDLSFSKYVELDCFRWLYVYGHICDFLSRYAQLKEYILSQSEQLGDWHQMKTTGPREQDWSCDEVIKTPGLKRLEHLNLNLNTVNWWIFTGRDDVTKRRSSAASYFT